MGKYEIIVESHISTKLCYGFDKLDIRHLEDGTTVVTGIIADQAMLFALLGRIRDLGVKLRSVQIKDD